MREDFVSFNLAKKLKEKGFNKNCLGLYVISTKRLVYNVSNHAGEDFTYLLSRRDNDVCIEAPTIYQVLKWLREEKMFNVNMRLYYKCGWYYTIQNADGEPIHSYLANSDDMFRTYEEAALAGIEYVLDNLI